MHLLYPLLTPFDLPFIIWIWKETTRLGMNAFNHFHKGMHSFFGILSYHMFSQTKMWIFVMPFFSKIHSSDTKLFQPPIFSKNKNHRTLCHSSLYLRYVYRSKMMPFVSPINQVVYRFSYRFRVSSTTIIIATKVLQTS